MIVFCPLHSKPVLLIQDYVPKMYGGAGAKKEDYREWQEELMESQKDKKLFFNLAKKAGVFRSDSN